MIGKNLIELASVDSTNTYASQVVADGDFEDGTVVWAHDQFAGRGQHDHLWSSESGKNLTLTICLKPRFLAPDRQFQLNKAIALGVLDFICSVVSPPPVTRHLSPVTRHASPVTCHALRIKWPNDLYVGNHKIGGILIENMIMGSTLETSLAGIGININQTGFSPDLPNPVSLINFIGHETDLKEALYALCGFLNKRYLRLIQNDLAHPDQEFDQNLLGFDQWRTFLRDGSELEGKIKGVDHTGRLILETHSGEALYLNHGEIEYVI